MPDSKKHVEVLSLVYLNEVQSARIKAISKQIRLTVYPNREFASIPSEVWKRTEVLLSGALSLPKADQVPNLRWLQIRSAGVELALEQDILELPELVVTTASGTMAPQMGEYTLMAILMLGHRLPAFIRDQQESVWGSNALKASQPLELRHSTVGIVGYGSIGRELARLLQPFGTTVLAAKRDAMHPEDQGYMPAGFGDPEGDFFTRLYPIEGLKDMLRECDFVVVALPHTPDTHELFDAEIFGAMKPGAFLVNVSRGGLIHEGAMLEALKSGQLGGAVLDVFQQEPLPAESPFWSQPNVIITPHVSGISAYGTDNLLDLFIENLKRYLAGENLLNEVNLDHGY